MQVTYNDFTGELVKLERAPAITSATATSTATSIATSIPDVANIYAYHIKSAMDWTYCLSIYDSKKQVTHSFIGVKLEDVKFLDGTVTFGG